MKTIDKEVLAAYDAGIEKNRLRTGLGLIEFERTKEILLEKLPPPPAVIYDIGGGYGEYAYFLAALGYEVYLYDLSEKNTAMAREMEGQFPVGLKAAEVADAREIDRPDGSGDAVLLLGPLYHITEYGERQAALKECLRLLKPGGLLAAAAITRYATTLWSVTSYGENGYLDEPEFCEMLEHEIKTGHHIKNPKSRYKGMGRSYFHLPDEFKEEIDASGFTDTQVLGVIGPCWLVPGLDTHWRDLNKRESLLAVVRLLEKEKSLLGLSTHLLSVSRKESDRKP